MELNEIREILGFENYEWYMKVDASLKKNDAILVLPPPGWGSSIGYTVCYTIYHLCQDRERTIGIVSGHQDINRMIYDHISDILKNNKKLKKLFGDFYSKDTSWNRDMIRVIGSDPTNPNPSIAFTTINRGFEGMKPDLTICDGVINSFTNISKIQDKFSEIYLRTNKQTLLISHRYSAMNQFIQDPRWSDVIKIQAEDYGMSTCSKRFPMKELIKMQSMIEEGIWDSIYMQETDHKNIW